MLKSTSGGSAGGSLQHIEKREEEEEERTLHEIALWPSLPKFNLCPHFVSMKCLFAM